jgi:hypothetical protein
MENLSEEIEVLYSLRAWQSRRWSLRLPPRVERGWGEAGQ